MPSSPHLEVKITTAAAVEYGHPTHLVILRTIAYPDGEVHEVRAHLQGDAYLVVDEALRKASRRLGRPISVGSLLELLAAEYIAGP